MPPPDLNNTYIKPPSENQILKFIKTLGYDEDPKTKLIAVSKMDKFEWQAVERSSRPSKWSKLLYTRFTKLIIDYILSNNKSIPSRSSSKLHSSQDDQPITKLSNTIKGDYKFGMEIPDLIISDAIKKSVGYKYYMAMKVESEKAKIVNEPEEKHISPVKTGRGKGFMCYGDQVVNVSNILNKYDVPRKTRSLIIVEEIVVGQKLKGRAVEDPSVQSFLDLQKGSKASRLKSLRQKKQPIAGEGSSVAHKKFYDSPDSDATLYSSSSEESANKTYGADEFYMDLSNDNPNGDDDVARYGVFMHNKSTTTPNSTYLSLTVISSSLDFIQTLLDETPSKSNTTHPTNQKLYDTLYEFVCLDHDALNDPDAEPSFHKRAYDNQDPLNNYERENKKKRQKDVDQEDEYIRTHLNPELYTKSGSTNVVRKKTWFDLLLKSDIDQNENHILGPSTVAITKNLKAIIQKDELTIADLEGAGLERPKQQYQNDVELEYHVSQLKQAVLLEAKWNSDEDDVSKPDLRRSDDKEYELSYADLLRLGLNNVEDIYLLQVQDKLHHLPLEFVKVFNNALLLFIRRVMIHNRVDDIQLGLESYQQTLNLTKHVMFFEGIDQRIPFTMFGTHKGVVYLNQHNIKSFMKLSEVNKFCNGTLIKIHENLVDMVKSVTSVNFKDLIGIIACLRYGYIKNHKKTVKNGQARARESEEYKAEAKESKPKPGKVKPSLKYNGRVKIVKSSDLFSSLKPKDTSAMEKAQRGVGFALDPLTELAQHVTSKKDMLKKEIKNE
ncbi:hypothetical protein Tco_0304806 [Tanacetum coccineum]